MTDTLSSHQSEDEAFSWPSFLQIARDRMAEPFIATYVWWRGQAEDWPLSSAWERYLRDLKLGDADKGKTAEVCTQMKYCGVNGFGYAPDNEEAFLRQFRDLLKCNDSLGVSQECINDPISMMAVGRHYGLVTPLLDWTASPYVAAFFALSSALEQREKKCFIYMISGFGYGHRYDSPLDVRFIDFDQLNGIGDKVFTRLHAQQGRFTKNTSSEFLSLNLTFSGHQPAKIETFELDMRGARGALRDLAAMGVTYRSLFPDLSGAALDANLSAIIANDPQMRDRYGPDMG